MEDQKSDDSLPAGWRVEVRVRKNGKKDKCYFNRAEGLKFYSKVEVIRYLNVSLPKYEEMDNSPSKQSAKNVVVEKGAAEGLPPGWIKEIKITKNGRKVRRDPYYTDPVSGYVFRSMKNALHYVETGEVGRKTFKSNNRGNDEEDLEDDKICSPIGAKEQKLAAMEISRQIMDQSLKFNKMVKDEQIHTSATTGECASLSERTSDQCRESAKLRSSSLSETKGPEQIEEAKDSKESTSASCPAVEIVTDKQSFDSEVIRDQVKKTQLNGCKLKGKKELHLPRRSSKRLAGIELEPTPELKIGNRARRTSIQQFDEAVAIKGEGPYTGSKTHEASLRPDQIEAEPKENCVFDTCKNIEISVVSNKRKHFSGDLTTPIGSLHPDQIEAETKANCAFDTSKITEISVQSNKRKHLSGDLAAPNGYSLHSDQIEAEQKTNCAFDTSKITEISVESNKRNYLSGDIATPNGSLRLVQTEAEPKENCAFDTSKITEISVESNKRNHLSGGLATPNGSPCPNQIEAEPKANCAFDTSKITEISIESNKRKHLSGDLATENGSQYPDHIEAEPKANCAFDTCKITEIFIESNKSKHLSGDFATPNGHAGKAVETGNKGDENQECTVVLPVGNLAIPEAPSVKVDIDNKANEMTGPPLDLPLADLWTDPCIAFAIQTLTGRSFDPPKSTEVSPESNNRYPSGSLTTPQVHGRKEETGNEPDENQGGTVVLRGNQVIQGHSEMAENSDKTDEKPGSPLDLPYADIWRDPCIEFAIKTLTGAIPVGCDLDNQDYIKQPLTSSQTEASSGLPLPDVGVDYFCQTDYLCNQYDITEKPVSFSTGTVSLWKSGGARLHQGGDERRDEFQR